VERKVLVREGCVNLKKRGEKTARIGPTFGLIRTEDNSEEPGQQTAQTRFTSATCERGGEKEIH